MIVADTAADTAPERKHQMTLPSPQPGILDIALYVSGDSAVAGHADVLKLSSNENPFGCSPAVPPAIVGTLGTLHRYPSTDHAALRAAIGAVHGLDPDRIICGVGSDEVLQFVTQAYAGPGDEVITTQHGFSIYPILARAAGAVPVTVPEQTRVVDVDAMLAAITPRTRVVFLANPANPTGTMIPEGDLWRLAAGLPGHVVLVHDGAYAEYVDGFDGGAALVDAHPNVIMTRTFSKIYGLGGLRIGWGYAQRDMIDVLTRLRQPFNLSDLQMAAAMAAVRDRDFVAMCRHENATWRRWLTDSLRQTGVQCDESHANFVLARFMDATEAAVLPQMVARDAGHIVITGSLSGFRGLPGAIGYAASKAGTMVLAESLHCDLHRTGVRVQLANPGFIKTRLTAKNDFAMPFLMTPEQAAGHMMALMKSRRFKSSFPTTFSWLFRGAQVLPDWLYYRIFA